MQKVLITQLVPESCVDFLWAQGYEVSHTFDMSEDNICAMAADVDAILSRGLKSTARIMDAAPKLKIIARFGVGTDMIDMKYAEQKGIWVSITPEASARSVAEHTLALLMACAKRTGAADTHVKQGDWKYRDTVFGCELYGKKLGLVGLGKIGRLVAEMAKAFGMEIIGYDAYLPEEDWPKDMERAAELACVFCESDFVSLHCPLTEQTKNMVDRECLRHMKPGAFLINTARGELIDEAALYEALTSRTLRGAGVDVSRREPPDANNPLLTLENFVLTPHLAAVTDEAMYRMGIHAAWCIDDVLQGRPPRWPANRPAARENILEEERR